ncbi:MAG: hypothetical protein BWZ10_02732 [candidate division BRC1 bacterium ADurb.BinA364]|nr:MAG: hypothetical protein BWZ10_02732 [candidate division BRC1 bacterium ADurb.BinA364]
MPQSSLERAVGLAILAGLAAIAAAIAWKGQRYDPAIFGPAEPAARSAAPAAPAAFPPPVALEGWAWAPPVEEFDAESLYRKIDGRDAFFLERGFRRLRCVSLVNQEDPDRYVDLFLYRMERPEDARSVFLAERPDAPEALDAGDEAYLSHGGAYILLGPYYIVAIPGGEAEAEPALRTALAAAAFVQSSIAADSEG